jgi:hypothetical protein
MALLPDVVFAQRTAPESTLCCTGAANCLTTARQAAPTYLQKIENAGNAAVTFNTGNGHFRTAQQAEHSKSLLLRQKASARLTGSKYTAVSN